MMINSHLWITVLATEKKQKRTDYVFLRGRYYKKYIGRAMIYINKYGEKGLIKT